MELDFQTVKALSSPTRVHILRNVLEKESTPTQLSDELGKSKSTVSSHLQKLTEADLLEKDKKEGRKRVTYRPTQKAEAIVEGRERKVKFSIASSIITSVAGFAMLGYGFISQLGFRSASADSQLSAQSGGPAAADAGDSMGIMSKGMESAARNGSEAAEGAANAASQSGLITPETAFLYIGVGLLSIAVTGFLYGWTMKKLG